MRILIISDIHANIVALEAVLSDTESYDAVWCLGDLVGYGPDPNACIECVSNLPNLVCLIGNHDQAALGKIPLSRFNREAGEVVAWTIQELTEENLDFMRSLPTKVVAENFTLVHGSPQQHVWEYILDLQTANRSLDIIETDYCIVGHSHLPLVFYRAPDDPLAKLYPTPWKGCLNLTPKMILNPGSVGQPRDRDPRSSYAILDTSEMTWEPHRAEYEISRVQARILEAGLPERQAIRLMGGW
jgi:predicted phosphodiesterase